MSSRWTTTEKLLGTLVVPLEDRVGVLVLGGGLAAQQCTETVEVGPALVGGARTVDCTVLALPHRSAA